MKPTPFFACVAAVSIIGLAGCHDANDDIPAGASFKDPMGINAKAAKGAGTAPKAEVSPTQKKLADQAKNFGADMNAKYGGKH